MHTRVTEAIGGYRLIFEPEDGWRCECVDFNEGDCEHVLQAERRHLNAARARDQLTS